MYYRGLNNNHSKNALFNDLPTSLLIMHSIRLDRQFVSKCIIPESHRIDPGSWFHWCSIKRGLTSGGGQWRRRGRKTCHAVRIRRCPPHGKSFRFVRTLRTIRTMILIVGRGGIVHRFVAASAATLTSTGQSAASGGRRVTGYSGWQVSHVFARVGSFP